MSDRQEKLQELNALVSELETRAKTHKLDFYKPTTKQREFHDVGLSHRQRLLMAGNQCLTAQTFIETPEGAALLANKIVSCGFDVLVPVDGQPHVARARPVFLKGLEPAFRVYLDNGRWFECSRKHRVLCADGKYRNLDQLVQLSSGLRLTGTGVNYSANYDVDARLRDLQLHVGEDICRVKLPSPTDVPPHIRLDALQRGVAEHIQARTHVCPQSGHPTTSAYDRYLIAGLCESFSDPNVSQSVQRSLRYIYQERKSHDGSDLPRGVTPTNPGSIFVAFTSPMLFGSLHIWGVEAIGTRPILDFHVPEHECYYAAGTVHHNTGKTLSAAMEVAYHMTGEYPDWWHGHRFKHPPVIWAGGVTAVSTRDNPQRLLLGRKRDYGTGSIPKHKLVGTPVSARGEPDSVDSFQVEHISGGHSICYFKNYAQGREKWQGETLDFVWMDEEPPYEIYEEALTRLNRKKGHMAITFTPLMGMTEVVSMFLDPSKEDKGTRNRIVVHMTLEDATFYNKEDREDILNQYPEHMRRARAMGLPVMGEGLVYPIPDDDILCDAFEIPRHYRRLVGMDFGVNHPTAAVWIAYSPDTDTIYVYDVYKERSDDFIQHADAINSRGDWIPVAWPHDGLKTEMGSGKSLADLYRMKKVNMLRMSARYENKIGGRQAVEPVCDDILNRMRTGRFKVFRHLGEWFKEKNMYHRKDGKIVDYNDDLMSATRYAVMMRRFARKQSEVKVMSRQAEDYDPLGGF